MSKPRLRAMAPSVALLALVLLLAGALPLPARALAEAPFRIASQLEDRSGVLGGQTGDVLFALEDLYEAEKVQLWVVFVDTFAGVGSVDWADQTADLSDLGLNDALLAVAVEDRAYAYSVDMDFPLTEGEMNEVMVSWVEPALVDNDWAGAAIAAVEGMTVALSAGIPTSVTTATASTTADHLDDGYHLRRWSDRGVRRGLPLGPHRRARRAGNSGGSRRAGHPAGEDREGRG